MPWGCGSCDNCTTGSFRDSRIRSSYINRATAAARYICRKKSAQKFGWNPTGECGVIHYNQKKKALRSRPQYCPFNNVTFPILTSLCLAGAGVIRMRYFVVKLATGRFQDNESNTLASLTFHPSGASRLHLVPPQREGVKVSEYI